MSEPKPGREEVLQTLREKAPRAMHWMEVVQRLGVPKSERNTILDILEDLTGLGLAQEMPGQRFRLQKRARRVHAPTPIPEQTAETSGFLTFSRRGFAFVAAEDGKPDIFIPPGKSGVALHGDRVRVRVRNSAKGREGVVSEVLQRGLSRIAGRLEQKRNRFWISPDDPRLPETVHIRGSIPLGIRAGDEVVAQIERYPEHPEDEMIARVLKCLGPHGSAFVEIEKIKIREGIEEEFSADVLSEAQRFGTAIRAEDKAQREDLTHLDLLTIDPPDARDHDDAVWAERLKDGGFRIVIAIADVSHYVRDDSAIDQEARRRGCSIYLPDRVIPMLPHELSSNLASLVPDEERLTMAVEVELGPTAVVRKHRFIEGYMRSRGRLAYGHVAKVLGITEEGEDHPLALQYKPLLQVLYDAAQALRARRERRGSLDFDLPEPRVVLDGQNEPSDVIRSRSQSGLKKAYQLIEDLMVLANEVVATDLAKRHIPAIYRVHGEPDENKIAVFAELANSLGYRLILGDEDKTKAIANFLNRLDEGPQTQALNYLLLRAMQQAAYDTNNIGHFALGAPYYLHFTSPIRRYPDLAVHRVIRRLVRGDKIKHESLLEKLIIQASEASRLERRAMFADREATEVYRSILMKERVGESFDATISSIAEHGITCTADEPFVDMRCPIDKLGNDWYELDGLGLRLVGKRSGHSYALGDRIRVRLEDVSIERRELRAVPESRLDTTGLMPPRRRPRTGFTRRGRNDGEERPQKFKRRRPSSRKSKSNSTREDRSFSGRKNRPGKPNSKKSKLGGKGRKRR